MACKHGNEDSCGKCRHAEIQKAWAERNKEYIKGKHKEIRKKYNQSPKGKAANGRKNSKRRYMLNGQTISPEIFSEEKRFRLSMKECAYCGSTKRLSLDHIVPLSKGGSHSLENWQCLCLSCNSRKSNICLL